MKIAPAIAIDGASFPDGLLDGFSGFQTGEPAWFFISFFGQLHRLVQQLDAFYQRKFCQGFLPFDGRVYGFLGIFAGAGRYRTDDTAVTRIVNLEALTTFRFDPFTPDKRLFLINFFRHG